jgi:hypothetical protein
MRKKGLATLFAQIFFGLVTVFLSVLLYIFLTGAFVDLSTAVKENTADRNTINMAQILMSSDRLAYNDGYQIHKGVFDVEKVRTEIIPNPTLSDEISFPNSIVAIGIKDLQDDTEFKTIFVGEARIFKRTVVDFFSCAIKILEPEFNGIFTRVDIIDIPEITSCYIENPLGSQSSIRDFPVSIRISDGTVHPGILSVNLRQY